MPAAAAGQGSLDLYITTMRKYVPRYLNTHASLADEYFALYLHANLR